MAAALAVAVPAAAQQHWDSHRVRAVETTTPPILDGIFEEREWGRGALIDALVQQEPNEGAPATEDTEIYLLYDAETLYIGIRAWDRSGTVTATEMRRDSDSWPSLSILGIRAWPVS